jgi:hypothetical protein
VDLATRDGVEKAYESLVREGTSQQQEALLNADVLREMWPQIRLPKPCRQLWESRLPELLAS